MCVVCVVCVCVCVCEGGDNVTVVFVFDQVTHMINGQNRLQMRFSLLPLFVFSEASASNNRDRKSVV